MDKKVSVWGDDQVALLTETRSGVASVQKTLRPVGKTPGSDQRRFRECVECVDSVNEVCHQCSEEPAKEE